MAQPLAVEMRRKVFVAASLLLTEVAWAAALVSIAKHHCSTTPLAHKALVVALLAASTAAAAATLCRSTRIGLPHLAALYTAHLAILCLAVAGPRRADKESVVASLYRDAADARRGLGAQGGRSRA